MSWATAWDVPCNTTSMAAEAISAIWSLMTSPCLFVEVLWAANSTVAADLSNPEPGIARLMGHVRGAPYHPQTQGKIERWHQTLKNRILLENYFFPADLEAQIEAFVDHYNHQRYHESINNLTPADVYFGRGQSILKQRERIKLKTMENRRLQYRKYAA